MAKVAGILGKKVGMTQLFDSKGEVRPATVLQAGPCVVTQHKSATRDGYESAQIGLVEFVKEKKLTKPMQGHFAKNNLPPMKFLREVPLEVEEPSKESAETNGLKVGQRVLVDIFDGDRFVDIVGVSKGRGFAGVVRRHHFRGSDATHGSMFHRAPGSIGASSFPSRVFPGMRMGGQMGNVRVTVRNLVIVEVDAEENVILVKGAVPGPNGGYVILRRAKR
jgi:large subunit ribosomal protein L3